MSTILWFGSYGGRMTRRRTEEEEDVGGRRGRKEERRGKGKGRKEGWKGRRGEGVAEGRQVLPRASM